MAKIWRLELESTIIASGLKALTTMHFQTDVALLDSEASAATVLSEVAEHFGTTPTNWLRFTACMPAQVKLSKATIREEVAPGSGDVPEVADTSLGLTGGLGSIAGDQLPPEACMWVRFRTGTASRSSRGGTHLPPALNPAVLNSSGQWDGALITADPYLALINKMKDQLTDVFGSHGSDINPVIYSRTRRARGLSPYTFNLTETKIMDRVRWVRRRGDAP